MNNGRLSQKQCVLAIVMFIIGSSSLMVMGLEAKMDIWASILLAVVAGILVMLVYARLMSALPEKNFFEILDFYLGKVWSKVFIALLTWFTFDLCAIVLRNFAQFVITVGLPETPLCVALFIGIVICALAVRNGEEAMARWNQTFVFYVIGFLIIGVLLVSPNMNINSLLPPFDNGFVPIAKGALGVLTFPFAETVVFLLAFPAFRKNVSPKKVFVRGLLIGGSVILVTSVTDMLVLGTTIAENMYYPTYSTMSIVHFGDFIQRFEVIAAIVFITAVFLKITILLFGTCKGTAYLFGFQSYRFIVYPIMFLVVSYAIFSFDSMIYYHEWVFKVWPYYAVLFEILIPLLLLIIIEVKRRKMKKTAKPQPS